MDVESELQTTRLPAPNSLTKLAAHIYTYSEWDGSEGATWPEGRGLLGGVAESGMRTSAWACICTENS